jgi:hypothetical protein
MMVNLNNSYGVSVKHSLQIFYLGAIHISAIDSTGDYFNEQS